MKANQLITVEVNVLAAARARIDNMSKFCEDALATHLNILDGVEKHKIPTEQLAERTIITLKNEKEVLEKELTKLKADYEELNKIHKEMLVKIQHDRTHPMIRTALAASGIKKKLLAGQKKGKELSDKQAKKMADQLRASLAKGKPETK